MIQRMNLNISNSPMTRVILTATTLAFLFLFLVLPLSIVFSEAFGGGVHTFISAITDRDALSALMLTLVAACVSVPLNILFGLAAAWLLTKFDFKGKSILMTLIDIPFAIPPVISGFILILFLGSHGVLSPFLNAVDFQIIFSTPGIILATVFVTFPFVARELIPLMQEQGIEEEQAAISLGAGGIRTFWHVTLPNIKWALLYGAIICNARAMGEFGAVSVVSGHIRGKTNTLPLHIEILYNEYNFTAAFAVSSLLALLALFTLVIKHLVEWHLKKQRHMPSEETTRNLENALT